MRLNLCMKRTVKAEWNNPVNKSLIGKYFVDVRIFRLHWTKRHLVSHPISVWRMNAAVCLCGKRIETIAFIES